MTGAGKHPKHPILIVDDEPLALQSFTVALEFIGLSNIITCQDERNVLDILAKNDVEAVLMDMVMPYIPGDRLLCEIVLRHPEVPVVMVTGLEDIKTAVRCIRLGAFDYLTKPVEAEALAGSVKRALDQRALLREKDLLLHHVLTGSLKNPQAFAAIVTADERMRALFKHCEAIAGGGEPVLITGETGVGKELFARAIHAASGLAGEFVSVNVAGLDDMVFADTLFGHKKGAFTGAGEARRGMVDRAAGGTIFLDEIGDLSEPSQVKLLSLLQDREYFPLGEDRPRPVRARFLVATNKDVQGPAGAATMRRDLYYRLRTHHIHIPPLRQRLTDIPILLDHFLKLAAASFSRPVPACPRELAGLLQTHDYPGNVRELRAMVFDAVGRREGGKLAMEAFLERIRPVGLPAVPPPEPDGGLFAGFSPLPTLKEAADALVGEAMSRTRGNQRLAAALLGITPPALNKRLKNLGAREAGSQE